MIFLGVQEIKQACLDTDNKISTTFLYKVLPHKSGIMVPNSFIFDWFSVRSLTSIPSSVYQCKSALRRNNTVTANARD